jgi:V/A-type H+-transporting ATPase subunit E
MDDIQEKIAVLQNMILDDANKEKHSIAEQSRKQTAELLSKEMTKLERESSVVLSDAKKRAEEMRRRQILTAERQKSSDALRQQNFLLQTALKKFEDELVKLRERPDYADILIALAVSAAKKLKNNPPVKLRLAAIDASYGAGIAEAVNKKYPEAQMTFDADPMPILGGACFESGDGRHQINSDWQSRAQEVSDSLADNLLVRL